MGGLMEVGFDSGAAINVERFAWNAHARSKAAFRRLAILQIRGRHEVRMPSVDNPQPNEIVCFTKA